MIHLLKRLFIDKQRDTEVQVSQKSSAEWPTQGGRVSAKPHARLGLTGIFVYVLINLAIANCFLKNFFKNQFINT